MSEANTLSPQVTGDPRDQAVERWNTRAQSDTMRELVEAANALLVAERCPNCPDQGWYADGPTDDPEQVQCEWCECYPTSTFKARERVRAALQKAEQQ